jgi:hypothetical protein
MANDIDLLHAAVRANNHSPLFDLTRDRRVDQQDVDQLVQGVLGTFYGDAQLDGQVDFRDFTTLANNFGKRGVSWSEGNFDADDEVGFSDFTLLANHFGRVRETA